MGSFSLFHWVIVLLVVVLLFGGGRISSLMGDVAKGIKAFKKGMAEEAEAPDAAPEPPKPLEHQAHEPHAIDKAVDAKKL